MKKRKLIISIILLISFLITQPIPIAAKIPKLGSTVTNQGLFKTSSCEYNDRIYYAYGDTLWSIQKDGADRKQVCTVQEGLSLHHFTVLADDIYALVGGDGLAEHGRLVQIKPDGTAYKIYKGDKYDNYENLCAADGKLYYDKWDTKHHCIYSMKPDGSERKMLLKDVNFLVTDGKWIYYQLLTNLDGKTEQKIFRCNMKGKNAKEIVSTKEEICHFTIDGDYCYYVTAKYGNIASNQLSFYRKNLKTSSLKKVRSGYMPMDIYAEGKNLYFLDANTKKHTDELIKLNTSTGKSKVIKTKVWLILGVFENLIVLITEPKEDGFGDVVLVDQATGKELAQLGKWGLKTSVH